MVCLLMGKQSGYVFQTLSASGFFVMSATDRQ